MDSCQGRVGRSPLALLLELEHELSLVTSEDAPIDPFADRLASAADAPGWSDAQIRQLHARRQATGAAPAGRDSALVRRVATTNPRSALTTSSSASFEIVRLLDSHAKAENREREAQKGRGLRGLLHADAPPALEATVTGRTHAASAASSSHPHSRSNATSRPGSRAEQRAPASPPGLRVVRNSAARLMLGEGQLSSVSIPSKQRMGSSGSEPVDYLAAARTASTSRPPKSRAFATERGLERVATNFDVLPPHSYWQQEQADDWAAQAEAARAPARAARTPSAGRRPDWLRLADSRPASALAAELSAAALLEPRHALFLPAMRALELGLEVPLDAYPVVDACAVRAASARAEQRAPPPSASPAADAAGAAARTDGARRPATAPEATGAEAARASSPPGARAAPAAQPTPVAAQGGSAPRRASPSAHFFERRPPHRAAAAEPHAGKTAPAQEVGELEASVRGLGVALGRAEAPRSAGARGGSRLYRLLAAERAGGVARARGLSRSLAEAASREEVGDRHAIDALAAPTYGKRTGDRFFMCTASPAIGGQRATLATAQRARADLPQSSGRGSDATLGPYARDERPHSNGSLHVAPTQLAASVEPRVASARRAILNPRVSHARASRGGSHRSQPPLHPCEL